MWVVKSHTLRQYFQKIQKMKTFLQNEGIQVCFHHSKEFAKKNKKGSENDVKLSRKND